MRTEMAPKSNSFSSKRSSFLCIAYAFPPINRSGTFRTAGFVRHLNELGWDASVITVASSAEPIDAALGELVPPSTAVVRTPCVDIVDGIKRFGRLMTKRPRRGPDAATDRNESPVQPRGAATRRPARGLLEWATRLLKTPDSRIGWVLPGTLAGLSAVRRARPSVIYSTSPYASAHLIALLVSHWTRLPWVADFRDPWHDNPFRDRAFPSLDRWDAWLESTVLHRASHIVVNTPTMAERLCRRVPVVSDKCTTILNGYDAPLVSSVRATRTAKPGDFVITHCGQFYGPRSPIPWFEALRCVCSRSPALAKRLRFVQVGSDRFEGRLLADLAASAGVGELVRPLGPRSHAQALSCMAGSDVLALVGSIGEGGDLQIPNKLFEYLALRKPIIATVASSSPVPGILEEARAQAIVCGPGDVEGLADAIMTMVDGTAPYPVDAWEGVGLFDRKHRAAELASIFERIEKQRSHKPSRTVPSRGASGASEGLPEPPPTVESVVA